MNDILEIEFQLGYNLHWQDLDHKDFYQVMWQYDRLIKQKNMEQHGSDGNNLLSNGIEGFNTEMGKLDG